MRFLNHVTPSGFVFILSDFYNRFTPPEFQIIFLI